MFKMKLFPLVLLLGAILFNLFALFRGQATNNLAKNSKGKSAGKDRYFSKSYGEVQFNKYRGQLPPKGAMIECALDCLTLATCHCIGLNIQTSECHFYGMEESPSFVAWKSATNNAGSNGLTQAGTNWTNKDYIFFTRDIFADDSAEKVDISIGRKVLTSWTMEEGQGSKKSSKGKGKEPQKNGKSKVKITGKSLEGFPMPWIQFEFKEPMYITEIALQTSKEYSNELKRMEIRIGNEPISKFYESSDIGEADENGELWSKVKSFDKNALCFEHNSASSTNALFSSASKKGKLLHKSIKCQPCGLAGRFVTIQTFEPCEMCKVTPPNNKTATASEVNNKKASKSEAILPAQQFPVPIVSIQVYGYAIGGKSRD